MTTNEKMLTAMCAAAAPYFVSKAAPAWRQPCECEAYDFPHRRLSGKCRAELDWATLAVRQPMHEARAQFDAVEARSINRG